MHNNHNNYLPKRKSPHATWSEYAGGLYFITIVTENRTPYFGKINDGKILLYPSGKIAQTSILNIEHFYSYCKLVNYVVMPNHIHLIIFIDENLLPYKKRNLNIVNSDPTNKNKATQCNSWLSLVIGHLKSFITRQARKGGNKFGWQERYHDHIIRNMEDFRIISNYIDHNIQNWESDCFNTSIDHDM